MFRELGRGSCVKRVMAGWCGAWLGVALAGCGAGRAPVAFQIEPWRYRGVEGRKVTTARYELFTTLRDEFLLSAMPELLEAAVDYFRELVPPAGDVEGERMRVYLFADRGGWAEFTRGFTGPRAAEFLRITNGGYSERGVTVIQYVSHQTTFPIMAHEAFHQYVYHAVGRGIPAWVNEGMAVVCEGQRWSGERLVTFDPWHNPMRRNTLAEALAAGELFSLEELLATNAGRVVQLPSRVVGTYYAQLWALMLFLREGGGGKYAAGTAAMLRSLAREASATGPSVWAASPGEALFRRFITEDLAGFSTEFQEFVRTEIVGHRGGRGAGRPARR